MNHDDQDRVKRRGLPEQAFFPSRTKRISTKYTAIEGDRHIGSIMLDPQRPQDQQWFWTITARVPQNPADRGYAATRDQAMEDFTRQWLS